MLALCGESDAFFEWMKKAAPASASVPPAVPAHPTVVPSDAPPFEMSVADEKILAEAKLMDMSPLDSCHFRVSTAFIETSCKSRLINEQRLGSVTLTHARQ